MLFCDQEQQVHARQAHQDYKDPEQYREISEYKVYYSREIEKTVLLLKKIGNLPVIQRLIGHSGHKNFLAMSVYRKHVPKHRISIIAAKKIRNILAVYGIIIAVRQKDISACQGHNNIVSRSKNHPGQKNQKDYFLVIQSDKPADAIRI